MQDVNKIITHLQTIYNERCNQLELQLAIALEELERLKEQVKKDGD